MKARAGDLSDLLDRLLDRGVYLRADVIVTVAGVPLLGVSLTALLGSIDTLVAYGVFDRTDPLLATAPGPSATARGPLRRRTEHQIAGSEPT